MTWEILHTPTGVRKATGAWGASGLVLRRVSLGADTLELMLDLEIDAVLPWAFDDELQLFDPANVRRFVGRVAQLAPQGEARKEQIAVRVDGPWSYLEQTVYLQAWKSTDGTDDTLIDVLKSRIIVGQTPEGAKIATGASIAAALDYAIGTAGAALTVGTILAGVTIPYQELLDVTVAEVVRSLLRWTPDAVSWIDYTTLPAPSLHIRARADLASGEVTIGAGVAAVGITPRNDLVRPGVLIRYERTHSYNDATWTTHESDTAGVVTPAPRLLVHTIALEGSQTLAEQQRVKTYSIALSNPTFWKRFCGPLAGVPDEDLECEAGSTAYEETPIETSEGNFLDDDPPYGSMLPNLLVDGQLAEWMNKRARHFVARTRIRYIGSDAAIQARLGSGDYREASIRGRSTDAGTQTFSRILSSTAGEATPAGVAAALFAALSVLHYEGEVATAAEECTGALRPGLRLNVAGGRLEWATMGAMVQTVTEDIDRGRTSASFGPAAVLGAADLVERLRANRLARPTSRTNERISGQAAGSSGTVTGGVVQPVQDTQILPPAGATPLSVYRSASGLARVVYGIVRASEGSTYVPTIGGAPISGTPTLAIGGNGVVYIDATVDVDGQVTAAAIVFGAALPGDTATHAYIALAQITGYSAGNFTVLQATTGSLAHMVCDTGEGNVHLWGRI